MVNLNLSQRTIAALAISTAIPTALYYIISNDSDKMGALSPQASITYKFLPLLVQPISQFVANQIDQEPNLDKETKQGLKKATIDFVSEFSSGKNLADNITAISSDHLINLVLIAVGFHKSSMFCNNKNSADQLTTYLLENIKHLQILTNGLIDCHKMSQPSIKLIMYFAEHISANIESKLPPICKPILTFAKGLIYHSTGELCITTEETLELAESVQSSGMLLQTNSSEECS